MKEIELTQGQVALVDDDMYHELIKWKWYAIWNKNTDSFYVARKIPKIGIYPRKILRMHRFIMDAPDGMVVDHINHDTLDNRRENLRVCTNSQNMMNSRKYISNTSGYKGVCWVKKSGKWVARISINKKQTVLGYFTCPKEASKAYCAASRKYHGEYGCLK